MHNKAEEPIGKETDHLPYISSGVVCSSFVNIHLKRNKCVIVAFSDTFKITFWEVINFGNSSPGLYWILV